MNDFRDQVRGIVDDWPGEGYVVGVLPDRSDPKWSGRAVLELIEAADRAGGPSVVVDLAPGGTDLASRFEAGGGPGLAEMVDGEVELWEISHRSDLHRAVYLSAGEGAAGSELAGSEAAELAGKLSGRGRLLLVVLDREGAQAAAPAGYLDGVVRIGEADGAPGYAGVEELGRITARPGERRELPDREGGPRLVLPPEMRSERRRKRRIRRALIGLAILVALGIVAFGILGEQDLDELFFGSKGRSTPVGRVDSRPAARTPVTAAADSAAAVARPPPDAGERDESGLPDDPDSAEDRGPPPPGAAPRSSGPPGFRAVADSLARRVRDFEREAGRFRAAEIGCGALIEARRRADRLFGRLWLERMSLQPSPDSPAAATFRERSRQMETVERAYRASGCPAAEFEGP